MATESEYNSKFQSFEMLDNGTNGDLTANDGIYLNLHSILKWTRAKVLYTGRK